MIDTCNNEILSFARSNKVEDTRPYYQCFEEMLQCITGNKRTTPTILHTNQGAVYHSSVYAKVPKKKVISLSRAGTSRDNPIIDLLNGWIMAEMAWIYQVDCQHFRRQTF